MGTVVAMSKQRVELVEGGSSKFWEIEQQGSDLAIAWGKISELLRDLAYLRG